MPLNQVVLSVLVAWLVAQGAKIVTKSWDKKRFYPQSFFEGGGMPSSHTALVVSVSTAVGIAEGFGSSVFLVAVAFASIVMYEVLVTKKAIIQFAQIVAHHHTKSVVEKLGHTLTEIVVGAVIGIAVPVLIML